MIPVFNPYVYISDIFSVLKNLYKGNISGTSKTVKEFEEKIAKRFDRKYGVAVVNGSASLDLALNAIGLEEKDEVILPSFTIVSCLSAILRSGAKPIFCDVNSETWNMTIDDVQSAYTEKTKAVLMVHNYGLVADAEKIENFCREKNLILIEDAAEAHGQEINGKKCGSFGLISTFSFYANKHITTGEGGVLLTNDEDIFSKVKQMRNLDFKNENRFNHENFYWNYRMGGLQAAFGISQIDHLDKAIKNKKQQGNIYNSFLSHHDEYIQIPIQKLGTIENHYWVYGVLLKKENIRDKVIEELYLNGIETRPFFWPLHLQKALPEKFKPNNNFPVSENIGKNGLYLPLGKKINKSKIKFISNKLIESIKKIV